MSSCVCLYFSRLFLPLKVIIILYADNVLPLVRPHPAPNSPPSPPFPPLQVIISLYADNDCSGQVTGSYSAGSANRCVHHPLVAGFDPF